MFEIFFITCVPNESHKIIERNDLKLLDQFLKFYVQLTIIIIVQSNVCSFCHMNRVFFELKCLVIKLLIIKVLPCSVYYVGSDMKRQFSSHPIHQRHSEWVTLLSQDKEKVDYSSYISVFNTGF